MDTALEGMGLAFYTTLMGAILGGVCLRLLSNLVDSNIDHVVSHIAELTEIYILPILRRAGRITEEHQRKLRERDAEPASDVLAPDPQVPPGSPGPRPVGRDDGLTPRNTPRSPRSVRPSAA